MHNLGFRYLIVLTNESLHKKEEHPKGMLFFFDVGGAKKPRLQAVRRTKGFRIQRKGLPRGWLQYFPWKMSHPIAKPKVLCYNEEETGTEKDVSFPLRVGTKSIHRKASLNKENEYESCIL